VVEARVFQQTQDTLRRNGRAGGGPVRNQFGSLLKGLLHCGPCDCAMTPTHTAKNGNRRYRYYVCCNAQKRGRDGCPSKTVPAGAIEAFVVDRIRCVGRDPDLLREVIVQARTKDEARIAELEGERQKLERDLKAWHRDVQRLSIQFRPGEENGELVGRLTELHERIEQAEVKARQLREEAQAASRALISEGEAARSLAAFDPVWAALTPREQGRLIDLLVERVEYDGARSRVSVAFRPTGIRTLADELDREKNEQPREKRA
jgi:site-specific DNA recombinase